jgi:hypothetical protein
MSVENVGNPLSKKVPLFYIRESTLKKGLMNVRNVGNPLNIDHPLLYTRYSTLEKGLMRVENVGNPLNTHYPLSFTRLHTGERPYEYRECVKSYKRSDLNEYQKVHTVERP